MVNLSDAKRPSLEDMDSEAIDEIAEWDSYNRWGCKINNEGEDAQKQEDAHEEQEYGE